MVHPHSDRYFENMQEFPGRIARVLDVSLQSVARDRVSPLAEIVREGANRRGAVFRNSIVLRAVDRAIGSPEAA